MNKSDIESAEYRRMTEDPVPSLVIKMSLPTVLSMLITSIYNMADTFFVSMLKNSSAVGAIGIVMSLQSIIQTIGYGLAMGASSLVSRKLGERDSKSAGRYTSSAFFAGIICGALLSCICFIDLDGMLSLFGSTDTMLPYAAKYATVILIGAPMMCASFVLNSSLRAEGKATFSMIGMTLGGVINIILDPIFIFAFKLDITGAAIATVISQAISFLILLSFYLMKKSLVTLSFSLVSRDIKDYILIVKTGLPTFFRQGLGSLATTLLNTQVKVFDNDSIAAAVSVSNKIYTIVRSLVIGIGQGFQPVAGYNYGAKKLDRVKRSFNCAVLFGSAVSCACSVILMIFAENIIGIFAAADETTVTVGSTMLRFIAIALPVLGYSTFVNQLYQCLGFVKGATFLASCRQGIFFVPAILVLPYFFKLTGIQMAQPVADILTFAVSIPFHIGFMKNVLNKTTDNKL